MINKIKELIAELNNASYAYYNSGNPIMTDKEFDKKLEELKVLEEETSIIFSNSPTQNVGAKVLDKVNKIKIPYRAMLSLEKCHSEEEIASFANEKKLVGTLKLDGLSVRLVYNKGILESAMTRGDSEEGQDITEHIKFFKNVPLTMPFDEEIIIDGEAIILLNDFEKINSNQQYKNARNLASGTLACLDVQECRNRHMCFVAWELIKSDLKFNDYDKKLEYIKGLGFDVVPFVVANNNFNQYNIELVQKAQEFFYPIDGIVYKYQDVNYGQSLGRNAKCYLDAIAYKFEDEKYETELLGIDWEVGRSSVLTPVAYFNEINTGESVIKKCSLHNLSIMKSLFGTLTPIIGTKMTIVKSNQIIPMCIATGEIGDGADIELPITCPYCGEKLIIKDDTDSQKLCCPNENCSCRLLNQLAHYVSKSAMDIRGLSKETLSKLMDWQWVNKIQDIYSLAEHRSEWIQKSGFGIKSVDNILMAIEESKHCKLEQFITAIGIPLIGSKVAKDLAKIFSTWEEFLFATEESYDFTKLPNFGYEMKKAILSFNYTEANYIATHYLTFENAEIKLTNNSLEGLTFVITGKLKIFKNRQELINIIENAGGKVASAVSAKTAYLINNDRESTSSKNIKAKQFGISIITEAELLTILKNYDIINT